MAVSTFLFIAITLGIAFSSVLRPPSTLIVTSLVLLSILYLLCVFAIRRRRHLVCGLLSIAVAHALGWTCGLEPEWRGELYKSADHVVIGEVMGARVSARQRWWLKLRVAEVALVEKGGETLHFSRINDEMLVSVSEETARRVLRGERALLRVRRISRRQRVNFGDTGVRRRPPAFASAAAGPFVVDDGGPFVQVLGKVRGAIAAGIEGGLSGQESALAKALIIGDRNDLDPSTIAAFRGTGAAHLLAVSGLHISLVGQLTYWLVLSLLLRTPLAHRRFVAKPAALFAIILCWGYALLTGLAPPAFRAAIMATAVFGARAAGRPSQSGRSLWIAATILLAQQPALLWQPGFQLSFAAVSVLIGSSWLVSKRSGQSLANRAWTGLDELSARGRSAVLRAFVATAAATAVTSPLIAHHFGVFSPWGLIVNLFAVPFMGVLVLPVTMLASVVGAFSAALGSILFLPAGWSLSCLIDGLRWASELPEATISVSPPALGVALLFVFGVIVLFRRGRAWRIVGVGLLIVGGGYWGAERAFEEQERALRVTFLDVGAGDATLIRFPNGERMLVDAGPEAGDRLRPPIVVRALQRDGLRRLSVLALTHGHSDHAAGIPAVFRTIGAATYWRPLPAKEGALPSYAALARGRGATVFDVESLCGERRIGGVVLRVIHPCSVAAQGLSENDRSLVFRLQYGQISFLLPGDIESIVESELLSSGVLEETTVLKLPHHGSSTSSTSAFLDALRPRYGVASCGWSRRRPLPTASVTRRLQDRGVHILSTAELGAIEMTTRGRHISVRSARVGLLSFGS